VEYVPIIPYSYRFSRWLHQSWGRAAILWIQRHGLTWHSIPVHFGPWETVYTRYKQWLKSGLWTQITQILGVFPDFSRPENVSL
jgi:hypothetical protein